LPKARVYDAPKWLDEESFVITTDLAAPPGDDMPSIVRRVLEDRFGLVTHQETRDLPVYALVLANSDGSLGPNLRPTAGTCFDREAWRAAGFPRDWVGGQRTPTCGVWETSPLRSWVAGIEMPRFASEMRHMFDPIVRRDVVDQTGLTGAYDIDVDMFQPAAIMMGLHPPITPILEAYGLSSFPTALRQQLGVQLVDATAPGEVIVIDSADRPAN
jgi:uncharacterized protein (TIGR03435 family)